jgi:hypothetical protein
MSTFKLKSEKTKCLTQLQTLDSIHKSYEEKFTTGKVELPEKKSQLQDFELELKNLERKNTEEYTTKDIQKKSKLKTDIDALQKNIYDIENNISELEYYSKTNNILMEYYELAEKYEENPSEIVVSSSDENDSKPIRYDAYDMSALDKLNKHKNVNQVRRKPKRRPRKRNTDKPTKKSNDVLTYFGVDTKTKDDALEVNRKDLLDNLLMLIDCDKMIKHKPRIRVKICLQCNREKTLVQSEGYYVCKKCGEIERVVMEHERTNSKDPIPEKSGYPYKRINHLNEWIAQFQAKESTEIPKEVYDKITSELKKTRNFDRTKITIKKMKSILRKLRLNQYYEHIPHIISKITKLPPPTISREMEEKVRHMFIRMQEPFEVHRQPDRTNFLNYAYVLHKVFQLLELDNMLHCFPLLKSRDKLRAQDETWAKICKDCKWEFYPSV